MSIVRRAVVGAAVLGAGLASTAGIASAAPVAPPGVGAAITAADAAAKAGTQAGLAGAQAGLNAANAAATVAKAVGGVNVPGLDKLPGFTSVSEIPGLTQGLDALPSASDFTSFSKLPTDPTAFADTLTKGLSPEALTPDLSALDSLPGA